MSVSQHEPTRTVPEMDSPDQQTLPYADPQGDPSASRSRGGRTVIILVLMALAFAAGTMVWHLAAPSLDAHAGHSHASGPKALWTCSMHPQVIREEPGVCPICHMALTPMSAGAPSDQAGILSIDPAIVQNMGMRLAEVKRRPLRRDIRAVGYLSEAEPNQIDVSPRVSGWIEKLYADTDGIHVNKGDPLFEIYSPRLQVAVEELISAQRSKDAPAPGADALTKSTADALVNTTRVKLLQWGLTSDQITELARSEQAPRTVVFLSPATGHVTQKSVVEGSAVKEGDRVMRIVSHKSLWLDVQIYEQEMPFIHVGQEVEATVEAMPGRSYKGELFFIHPHLDAMTRTAMARVVLPNPSLELRPGMYATAMVNAQIAPDAVVVPREAVIDSGVRRIAFVARDPGHFQVRELKLGAAGQDEGVEVVQVLEGVAPGERVVTSGQFLLDAESRLREAIQKHASEHRVTGAGPATDQPGPTSMPTEAAP